MHFAPPIPAALRRRVDVNPAGPARTAGSGGVVRRGAPGADKDVGALTAEEVAEAGPGGRAGVAGVRVVRPDEGFMGLRGMARHDGGEMGCLQRGQAKAALGRKRGRQKVYAIFTFKKRSDKQEKDRRSLWRDIISLLLGSYIQSLDINS